MEDKFFCVKWKDETIGVLARIEEVYYAWFQTRLLKDREAGEIHIRQLSFEPDVLYTNSTLFEVFEKRIKVEEGEDPCYRLERSSASRPTDNFYVEVMNEREAEYFKKIIEDMNKNKQEGVNNAHSRN